MLLASPSVAVGGVNLFPIFVVGLLGSVHCAGPRDGRASRPRIEGDRSARIRLDNYKQGQAINQDLRRDRAASARHLRLRARYLPVPGRVQGRIDSFGYPVLGSFTIRLAHPTLPERDMVLPAQPDANGEFSVALPALEKTHRQVVVEGNKRDWRLARSWDWGRQPELVIAADRI